MNRRILTFAVTFVAMVTAYQAKAWNNVGHASIAYIAEQHLTPEAKEQCRKYLKHALPYYASWMDYWRNCKGFEETSSWHGVPVAANNKHYKSESRNAAVQIERICKKMRKYEKLKDSLVCDNLKYLIHMVGDMHCPSHSKYVDEPAFKQGRFILNGKKYKFHTFWDGSIGFYHKGMSCDEIQRKYDTLSSEEIAEICKGTPSDWAYVNAVEMRESHQLINSDTDYDELADEQKDRIRQIAVQQMLRGGYRLAHVLNEIFKY
ncbi:MAG: S1/P1 nuclease [Alistipes sp.]|nr:S1/P1 nuclease [Alistipes sp.]MBR0394636.1 S1/P1 nuclease [Alistipes sp.]